MTSSAAHEEARIRSAYADRSRTDRRYSWFNAGHLFLVQERERQVLALLNRCGASQLETKTILEIGCGTGYWLREFVKWGARPEHVTGVDLLPERVALARQLSPAGMYGCNTTWRRERAPLVCVVGLISLYRGRCNLVSCVWSTGDAD